MQALCAKMKDLELPEVSEIPKKNSILKILPHKNRPKKCPTAPEDYCRILKVLSWGLSNFRLFGALFERQDTQYENDRQAQ